MRTAILHIGIEKTGTTSIQRFLALNRGWLHERGFAFPLASGQRNSHLLALYARGPGRGDDMHLRLGLNSIEKRTAFAAEFADRFTRELAALPAHVHTVLLSSEHLHSRVVASDSIESVLALLRPHCERFRVLVYLRRQDRVATSLYSTAMKAGLTRDRILPEIDDTNSYYNYDRLLDRWAKVFGADAVVPRLLVRDRLVGGDLLADFAAACGLGSLAGARPVERENEGLQAVAQEFLHRASAHLPPIVDGEQSAAWEALVKLLSRELVGRGRLPTRDEAVRFQAIFGASNEQVRRRWFPELPALFNGDFSLYPDQDEPAPGFDDAVAVGTLLWRRAMAEIAFRDGRIARLTGDVAEAKRQFRLALTLHPGHAGAADQIAGNAAMRSWAKRLRKRWRRSPIGRRLGLG